MANATDAAIVVGINDYHDPMFTSLQGAVNDAENFEAWLVDPEGGDVPAANIVKIVSTGDEGRPRYDEIVDAITEMVERATDAAPEPIGRRLYLFMSGHGVTLGDLEDCGLFSANASELSPDRSVPGLAVAMAFKHAAAFGEVVLIMDCCREAVFNNLDSPIRALRTLVPGSGRSTLCSGLAAKWDRLARERALPVLGSGTGEVEVQGVFAHAVLKGLRYGADSAGDVTATGLKRFVEAEMQRLAPDQRPDVDVEPDDFVICSPGQQRTAVHITIQDPAVADFHIRHGKAPMNTVDEPIDEIGPGTYRIELPAGLYVIGWPAGDPDQYVDYREIDVSGASHAVLI